MSIYDPNLICTSCGQLGAFDTTGVCDECGKSERDPHYQPEQDWLDICENCYRHGVTRDGKCVYCGSGPKIGGDDC